MDVHHKELHISFNTPYVQLPGKQILSLGIFEGLVELSMPKFFSWVQCDKLADAHPSLALEGRLPFLSLFPYKREKPRELDFMTSNYMDHHYLKRHKVA